MAPRDTSAPGLRVNAPTLEPDPDFLAELSEAAAGSGAAGPPAGTMGLGWRTGLAAASVATVVASSAWMAAAMIGDSDRAPDKPASPITQPAEPRSDERGPAAPRDDGDSSGSADQGQQDRGTGHHRSGETRGTHGTQLPPAGQGDQPQGQQEAEVQHAQGHGDGPAEPAGHTTEKHEDTNDQADEGADQGDAADQDQQGYDDPGSDDGSDGLGNADQGDDQPVNDAGLGATGDNADQNLADLDGGND